MRPAARHLLGALRDAALLPLALIVVVTEDVVWRGVKALLLTLAGLRVTVAVKAELARLPGWAALPLFLIPEAAGKAGEVWVALLLLHGHPTSAALVYLLVRLVAAVIAVFIWQACQPALMGLAWFALWVGWTAQARNWALARTAPLRNWGGSLPARGVGGVAARISLLRRQLARHLRVR